MGSESTTARIPVIDFSGHLATGTQAWCRTRGEVLRAAEEVGCFEAVYPAVGRPERREFFAQLAELFALPSDTKVKNAYRKPFHGYTGQRPEMPLFESLGIDSPESFDEVQSLVDVMWPQGNPGFSKAINSVAKKLVELEKMVRSMIIEGLGVEKPHDGEVSDSLRPLVRVMNYKAPPTGSAIGLPPHYDMNFTTILCQDEINGLEVLSKDGDYTPVTPSADSLVVFIGDSFMAWSNGRLHSPLHRVTISGDHERFSAGLFMIPKAGWMIKPPEELVDEDHPALYKPYDHFEFLQHFYADITKGARVALEEHAGL